MKQIVCVWFPFWPIQRQLHALPELRKRIVVLHTSLECRAPCVVLGNRQALRQGIQPGMPLAEARSLVPRGEFLEHDPAGDRETLRELAWQCQRFTPRASASKSGYFLTRINSQPLKSAIESKTHLRIQWNSCQI